ncbi:1100_t:CDS:2, partial [Scutellospora calospora]
LTKVDTASKDDIAKEHKKKSNNKLWSGEKRFAPYVDHFPLQSLKRNGAPLTENEKLMVINVYNYLSEINSAKNDHRKLTLCKRVAEVLGVSERTVGGIVADWNKHND